MNRGTHLVSETTRQADGSMETVSRAFEVGLDGKEHELSITVTTGEHKILRLEDFGRELCITPSPKLCEGDEHE